MKVVEDSGYILFLVNEPPIPNFRFKTLLTRGIVKVIFIAW